jgi:DNA modification methylase
MDDKVIIYKKPNDLFPYSRNARTHSPEQVLQIAASIKEFGFTNPILIDDDNNVIAGHGRLMAAKKMGMDKVPCIVCNGWTKAQTKAYILADNKLALNAGWDNELLALELQELQELDFNLDIVGFNQKELDELLAGIDETAGLTDEDETPEVQDKPVSVLGDVWILGTHRIICGDCTEPSVVDKILNGVKPHLMVTDPPYGVEYEPEWRNKAARNSEGMGNRGLSAGALGKVLNDDVADWSKAWALFPGDVAYVWHAGLFSNVVADSLVACNFHLRSQIIWSKNQFAIGRGDYHWQHEPCWYAVRKGKKGHYNGDRKQSTLWQIDKPQKSETGHSTQKPVECMKRPIENNSSVGQVVYEPFSGSGTTIIAAEITGRYCYAIELNPAYVDVAIVRWQNFTGNKATHADTGKTFDEVSNGIL